MANVNIKFNGKDFLLSCDNGQEEHLEELAVHLNEKFDNLKSSLGNIGENKLLLITSITIMDEYFETKKKIEQNKEELNKLTAKFKELKSLVYEYKEVKEKEVNVLNEQLEKLKTEIEQNSNNYDSMIDKATNQIESFINKAHLEKEIQ